MFVAQLFVVSCILCLVRAAAFRIRGIDDTASYSNVTSTTTSFSTVAVTTPLSTSTPSTIQEPPYPIRGTGTGITSEPGRPRPTAQGTGRLPTSKNATVSASCTINIPNASFDWWFPATYAFPVGTLTDNAPNFTNAGGYLTYIPETETFDVASAITTDPVFTESYVYDSEWDFTLTYLDEYTVKPTAAITSIVTRNGANPLPSGNIILSRDINQYQVNLNYLPAASATITGAPNSTFAATSATAFVYFTAYEVVKNSSTETINLPYPSAYPYSIKGVEEHEAAVGTVPDEFLQQIPQSACAAGNMQTTVTVLVVLDLFYIHFPHANPFIVHFESSATGFEEEPETDRIVVAATKASSRPLDNGPATTPGQSLRPNVQTGAPSSPGDDIHNAGSNPAGPNAPEPTSQTVGTIGTDPVVIGPSSVVVVGSQTLKPGASPVTVGGQPVSLVPSGTAIVVGGKTSALPQLPDAPTQPQARPPPVLTIGSSTLTPNAATQFFIAPGQTLTPGGVATVDGTVVSFAPSASFVVIGGSTQVLPTAAPNVNTARPEIVIGGSTFTALSSNSNNNSPDNPSNPNNPNNPGAAPTFVVSGQTLVPGQAITVDGTTISLAPSASFVVVNGVTSTIANPAANITPPPLTIGNGVFTALPGSGTTYQIGSQLLTPGGVITVSGTTISLAPGATALVVNGHTTTIEPNAQPMITNPPVLTIGSHTYTAAPGSGTTFIIGSQTLTPGGTITVDGTTISLAPGATELIYGSSGRTTTTALFPATTTRAQTGTGTAAEASAGATGRNGEAAATSHTGTGHGVVPSRGLKGWALSLLVGFAGMLLG